jgi:uncharacterized membrane protein
MDALQATQTLEVIRTLMERTCQYRLLAASAGLAAGSLAGAGALLFCVVDAADPFLFGAIWGLVLFGSALATTVGTLMRGRERGEQVWSRQTRAVVLALAPALVVSAVLTVFFFAHGLHLWLPGVWMLCYGQGALATASYAPRSIGWLGAGMLLLGALAFVLGPSSAILVMGLGFGLGHLLLGVALLMAERREVRLRLHQEVA